MDQDQPKVFWLRFRYDREDDVDTQLLMSFPLEIVDSMAVARRFLMAEKGENFALRPANSFARKLA